MNELLPAPRLRYFMGIGDPVSMMEVVRRGVDIFDCVLPTRVARNGGLLTWQGRMNLRNARYAADPLPVEPGCDCYACQHFSRAYIRHLIAAKEMLSSTLLSIHNLHTLIQIAHELRQAIFEESIESYAAEFFHNLKVKSDQ